MINQELDLGPRQGYMGLKYHMEEAYLEKNINVLKAVCDPKIAIFSKKYYNDINKLDHTKIFDYCFIGSINSWYERRIWVINFAKKYFTDKSIFINTDNNKNWIPLGIFDLSNMNIGYNPKKQPDNQSKNVQYRIIKDNFFYFQSMCHSKFILCPAGDSSWSFRFYETLMCKSIPIIEKRYHTYRTLQESKIKYNFILKDNINQNINYNELVDQNTELFKKYHLLN